jgi:hypothetical protein
MTPEEIVHMIGNIANRPDIRDVQNNQIEMIRNLVKEEREACAKIADASEHGKVIAHNIRARGGK